MKLSRAKESQNIEWKETWRDRAAGSQTAGIVKTSVKTPVKILQLLQSHPEMTLAQVAANISKSLSAVERASSKLVKEGRLKYVGPQKGGHWELSKDAAVLKNSRSNDHV